MHNTKTAGIIIIGNEILSGKVRDSNSYFLACELRKLGVDVRRIFIIPDEIDVIGSTVHDFSDEYDYVFTSGGVGPTHDDVTMAGIAKGFGLRLVRNADIEKLLCSRYRNPLNAAMIKMTEVPEGTEIIMSEGMRYPVIYFRNIFIFAGIPEYLRDKFTLIRERFRSSTFHLKKLFLNGHESEFAEILAFVDLNNKEVNFGSYPVLGQPDYRVVVTAESKSEQLLDKAMRELMDVLPHNILHKVE
ncbi:MAG: competence/damage-inducible protein A [Nitrospiraceae bacterium]|nr:MAG: competence/damage-inducible protein A [Nitrospiraceae bacterium]